MLVGDLSQILRALLADYNSFGLEKFISSAVSTLGLKGSPNQHLYVSQAADLKNKAISINESENPILKSSRVKDLFSQSAYTRLLPSEIAEYVSSLIPEDINVAAPSTEAAFLLARFKETRSYLAWFVAVAAQFKVDDFILPKDEVALGITLPKTSFSDDVGELGSDLRHYDAFFGDISEYATGKRLKPKLAYASTSILHLIMTIDGQTAVYILNVIKACLDTAKSAVSFGRTLSDMRRNGVDERSVADIKASFDSKLDQSLEAAVKSALFNGSRSTDQSRVTEIESRLISNCRFTTKKLEHGVSITLERVTSETLTLMLSDENHIDSETAKSLIDMTDTLQRQLTDEIQRTDPLLLTHR